MLITPTDFRATLVSKLEKDALLLPLSELDRVDLLDQLGEDGNYTYLVLRADNVRSEVVKVTVNCDELVLERGQDSTTAKTFPRGTCVLFLVTPMIVKHLICNYDCCADEDCPCAEVKSAGLYLPVGNVNSNWTGTVVFSGDLPMAIGTDLPTWITATIEANHVTLIGTPTTSGTYNIAVSATNCSGAIVVQQGVVVIN